MSENASDRGKEKGNGTNSSEYIIDETVSGKKSDGVSESWDIDIDPSKEETHIIRAIARSNNTKLRAYILPEEEVEHAEGGENVWWEYRSASKERIADTVEITHKDEEPYYHEGDYVLFIKTSTQGRAPDELKFSVKFRRE